MKPPTRYAHGRNPASLANLKPIRPGETRNPSGKNGAQRPFSDAIRCLSAEPLPEHLRLAMNVRIRQQLFATLGPLKIIRKAEEIPDFYQPGITWAGANAVRQSISAILEGNISAAVEIREAVEGRATARLEFMSQGDKLEELLDAFRKAAKNPPTISTIQ